jgi:hypothetical protein
VGTAGSATADPQALLDLIFVTLADENRFFDLAESAIFFKPV